MIRGRKKPSRTGRIIFGFVVLLVLYVIWANIDFSTPHSPPTKKSPPHTLPPRRALTSIVNMLIGTAESGERQGHISREGKVWVGAGMPFGMVKTGIDSENTVGGYSNDRGITTISMTHASGCGAGNSYQVIAVRPFNGGPAELKSYIQLHSGSKQLDMNSDRANQSQSPGYFGVDLPWMGVRVDMVATHSAAVHSYTLLRRKPNKDGFSSVIVDVSRGSVSYGSPNFLDGHISMSEEGVASGFGNYRETWSRGNYTLYFCVIPVKPPTRFGTINGQSISNGPGGATSANMHLGAYYSYDVSEAEERETFGELKIGISYVSAKKACQNVRDEIGSKKPAQLREESREKWDSLLNLITVEGSRDDEIIFYSSMYRSMLMPVNQTNENPFWKSNDYWNDFYTFWDIFRSLLPMYNLILPDVSASIVRSLIEIYQHEGFLPDSRVGGRNGMTQGGSNAAVVIADAYVKNIEGVNWRHAFEALVDDATLDSPNFLDTGRDNRDWHKLGYVPFDSNCTVFMNDHMHKCRRTVSRTMEYAYNDFNVYTLANGLENDNARQFLKSSSNWQNLYKADETSLNTSGFVAPRFINGPFIYLDPMACTPRVTLSDCFLHHETYEDSSWTYTFYTPHDMHGAIKLMGGRDLYLQRLNTYFDNNLFFPANEPGFLIPYLYNYVGRPDLTARTVHKIIRSNYENSIHGIPGNDDAGALGSFFMFCSLGFFPVAGQDLYLIGTPFFKRAVLNLGTNRDGSTKQFIIIAEGASDENIYIQSATLFGKPLLQAWFTHTEIAKSGGTLVFEMGRSPSDWGKKILPPNGIPHF